MGKDVFTREEFLGRAGAAEADLEAWLKAKLIKPVGFADEGLPLFGPADIGRALHIRKLSELGYGPAEIQKIVKKFGWPVRDDEGPKPERGDKFLTVGRLAERSGVSPRTIKHWEEMGIIEPEMRSGGGFRLYAAVYIHLCTLIRDLQLFGYTLEEIKAVSGHVRDFLALSSGLEKIPPGEAGRKLEALGEAVEKLRARMAELKKGIERWEDLLKQNKKEIAGLKARNAKRSEAKTKKD